MSKHKVEAIEIVYPSDISGIILDSYRCNDNETAQHVVDDAIESAKSIERQRIITAINEWCDKRHSWADNCDCAYHVAAVNGESND